MDFNARDEKLETILFAGDQKFKVPRYQRPYSWSADQIVELWTDLSDNQSTFSFLGTLIFNYEDAETEEFIEIIDGQQRILTVTIFFAVLRDLAKEFEDENLSNRIQRKRIAMEDKRGEETYIVKPGQSLSDFFVKYIQSQTDEVFPKILSDEEKLVVNNYNDLKKRVVDLIERKQNTPSEIIQGLWDQLDSLMAIKIDIPDDEQAYTIFETVNARGVELSVADLLKNLIFKNIRASADGRDTVKEKWEEIENLIVETDTDISRYLRHHWLSKYTFVSEKKLYREIKRHVTDFNSFLDELADAARWYNRMMMLRRDDWTDYTDGIKLYKSLRGVRAMGVRQCYIIFLCLLRNQEFLSFSIKRLRQGFALPQRTDDYTAEDFIKRIEGRMGKKADYILHNNVQIPEEVFLRYSLERKVELRTSKDDRDPRIIPSPLATFTQTGQVFSDPKVMREEIIKLIK